jgi:hypothetical protein
MKPKKKRQAFISVRQLLAAEETMGRAKVDMQRRVTRNLQEVIDILGVFINTAQHRSFLKHKEAVREVCRAALLEWCGEKR